ncbi:MAG: AMP-binding protein, partial [Spirochaetaceae bacterium]|nr:AMP-binding protein [Spirochaetaceae bacterium]
FQGYTLTEVSSAISCNTMEAHKLGTSGRMLPNLSCRILNSGGYPTGIGEAGEICVEGPLVMKGYFKNEDAAQEALRSGWLSTGDMGYVDEDGFLVVTGRKANLLASPDGARFSPEIIEEAIMSSSPFFRQVLVYSSRGRPPCALVVLDESHLAALAEKKRFTARGEAMAEVVDAFFAYTREGFWQKRIPPAWRPVTFRVLEEGFCAEAGTLNAARKMVRERIIRSSQQILESMYAAGEDSPASEANLETVWRLIQKTLGVKV